MNRPEKSCLSDAETGGGKTTLAFWRMLLGCRGLIILCATLFFGSLIVGFVCQRVAPFEQNESEAQAQYAQIEKIFGPYRVSVRDGQAGAIIRCTAMIFGCNLLGCILRAVSGTLVIPALALIPTGVDVGRAVANLHGTSWYSVAAFLAMVGLEWCGYILSAAAGANIGLALVFPKLKAGGGARRDALRQAIRQSRSLYLVLGLILGIQAVAEIFYVRKVLLMGGTGIPLMPF